MMRLVILASLALSAAAGGEEPIRLHPKNPHYFLFREDIALGVKRAGPR